jgi:yeast amino acid transporter
MAADTEAARKDEITAVNTNDGQDETVGDLKREHDSRHVGNLNRKLKSRHVQFMALSSAIGTGVFVGSGQMISLAGPLSAVLVYLITGFNLYCVINSLGEMAAYLPLPGAVPVYATRYLDEALGFTLGCE